MKESEARRKDMYNMDSREPIRPMSWYCGSQLTTTVESSASREDTMVFMLCVRDDHGIITPFGADVLPDVYCRKHSWSPVKCMANSSTGERSGVGLPSGTSGRFLS